MWVQQISVALVIILKCGTKPMERAPIITAETVPVTTAKMTIIERIITMKRMLVTLKHKKGSKDRCYRLYQQQDP